MEGRTETPNAAARRVGVHGRTIIRWIKRGLLPAALVNGRYRIAVVDVDKLVHAASTVERAASTVERAA